jgi:hypothetical protein
MRVNSLNDGKLLGMMYNQPDIVNYWWLKNNRMLVLNKNGVMVTWNLVNLRNIESELKIEASNIKAAALHLTDDSHIYIIEDNAKTFKAFNVDTGK